ncbi:hypothetical protein AGMMS50239_26030 [Bacteroidia bacterium]|nr:hypothetical protein AGMMS50239_26030 [Bacteroidia bacterium]
MPQGDGLVMELVPTIANTDGMQTCSNGYNSHKLQTLLSWFIPGFIADYRYEGKGPLCPYINY